MCEFLEYMRSLEEKGELQCKIDFSKMEADLAKGLYLNRIFRRAMELEAQEHWWPYNRYEIDKIEASENIKGEDISKLRQIFSKLESLFHGQSSGIDPLNCYLQHPLLIHSRDNIAITGIPEANSRMKALFSWLIPEELERQGRL